MSTNTVAIQSFRKIKPVSRKGSPVASIESSEAPVININMAEKMDSAYIGRQNLSIAEPETSTLNMPPLVRAYFKGRDNDPL